MDDCNRSMLSSRIRWEEFSLKMVSVSPFNLFYHNDSYIKSRIIIIIIMLRTSNIIRKVLQRET
jgi:hypothetical protein